MKAGRELNALRALGVEEAPLVPSIKRQGFLRIVR